MIAVMTRESPAIARGTTPLGLGVLRALGLAAVMTLSLVLGPALTFIALGGVGVVQEALARMAVEWPDVFLGLASTLVVLVLGYRWVPASGHAHKAGMAALVLAATGASLAAWFATLASPKTEPAAILVPACVVQTELTFALLFAVAYDYMQRLRTATDAAHADEQQRVALERELEGAQLQLLQAQVEPHFLFNTLANLRRLVRTDRAGARAMLAHLRRYLEEALPRLRDDHSTLARELGLVQAYLAVHQVRLGTRLCTEFDVPEELGARPVPPMVLLTLVENAIKHGVQPLAEGAQVRVTARSNGVSITLVVSDTGCGMGTGSGGGTGLANLRARLGALYGTAGSLSLKLNEPRGLVATVVLPETTA